MPSRPTRRPPSPSSRARAASRPSPGLGGSGRLDDQLCFALYSASNAIQRAYAGPLKRLGLTYVQYLVLLVLWEHDRRTVGDIGRCLFLDSGTLTPVLRRLERSGFVTRRRALADEREVQIALTDSGLDLERELAAVRAEVAGRAALAPTAFVELREALRTLQGRLLRRDAEG